MSAVKNAAGGIDILLTPAVIAKLESLAAQVPPCPGKKIRKRQGPACGLAAYEQLVGADEELQGTFARPLTDQVWAEIDEGYEGSPEDNPAWEGDGDAPGEEAAEIFDENDSA